MVQLSCCWYPLEVCNSAAHSFLKILCFSCSASAALLHLYISGCLSPFLKFLHTSLLKNVYELLYVDCGHLQHKFISCLFFLGSESHQKIWIELCTDLAFLLFTFIVTMVWEASGILCHDPHLFFWGIRCPISFLQLNHVLNWWEGYILTVIFFYFLHRDIFWQVLILTENLLSQYIVFWLH